MYTLSYPLWWVVFIPAPVAIVSVSLSGWLADANFGNYKVFRVGAVLLFVATVMNCFLLILEELVWESDHVLMWIRLCFKARVFLQLVVVHVLLLHYLLVWIRCLVLHPLALPVTQHGLLVAFFQDFLLVEFTYRQESVLGR